MKSGAFLLLVLLILTIFFVPVNAVTTCGNATFSTLGQGGAEDILIYTYNETSNRQELLGQWNTSSPDAQIPCGDFNVVVRPSATARFFNPVTALTDAFAFIETYWIQIGVILALISFFWFGTRR